MEYNPNSDEASTFVLLNDITKNEYSIYTVHIKFSDKTIWESDTCLFTSMGLLMENNMIYLTKILEPQRLFREHLVKECITL